MNERDFEGQVVVVTGASGGVGEVAAEELARRGASVVLVARRANVLEEVRARCGDNALVVVADVTKRADVQRVFDEAIARYGHIDAWVNNVGRGQVKPVLALTDEDIDTMMTDNFKSVLYGMQVVAPHLQARGRGAIVNVSSLVAHNTFPLSIGSYAASKAAMSRLSDELRKELAESHPDVRVVVVVPGAIATDFGQNALTDGERGDSRKNPHAQSAEEVGHFVCEAVLRGRGDVHTLPVGYAMGQGTREKLLDPAGA